MDYWTILKRHDRQCICSVAIGRVVAVYTASTLPGHMGKLKDFFLQYNRTNYSAVLRKNWKCICSVVIGSVVAVYTANTLLSHVPWICINVPQATYQEKVIVMSTILSHDY